MLDRDKTNLNAKRHRLRGAESNSTAAFQGFSFIKPIVLIFVAAFGCIGGGWFELGLTIGSIGVIAIFIGWLIRSKTFVEGLLLTTFLIGYLVSWCIGFLGYRYVLPWRGFDEDILGEHFVLTAIIVLLAVGGTCLGGLVALRLGKARHDRLLFRGFPGQNLLPY